MKRDEHSERVEKTDESGRWIYGKYIPGPIVAAIKKPLQEKIDRLTAELAKHKE